MELVITEAGAHLIAEHSFLLWVLGASVTINAALIWVVYEATKTINAMADPDR